MKIKFHINAVDIKQEKKHVVTIFNNKDETVFSEWIWVEESDFGWWLI